MSDIAAISVSDWLDMMADTITLDRFVSYSASVTPSWAGAPTSYPAYIEMKNHVVVDAGGREVMARGKVFIGAVVSVDTRDKLTLPAGYVPLTPPIIAVNYVNDENGTHHTTLEIG